MLDRTIGVARDFADIVLPSLSLLSPYIPLHRLIPWYVIALSSTGPWYSVLNVKSDTPELRFVQAEKFIRVQVNGLPRP